MRDILQVPNPVLSEISEPVNVVDTYIRELVKEMEFCLIKPRSVTGVGLSAIQIGEKVRVILIKFNEEFLFLINPTITKKSDKCLTIC